MEKEKENIKSGLDRLNRELISDLYQNIDFHLQNIADEKNGFKFSSFSNETISGIVEYLIKQIMDNRAYLYLEKNHSLKNIIHKLSYCCKKSGDHLFSIKKYSNSIIFYEQSIDLHTQYLQPQFSDELLNLYSNLIICYLKKGCYERVIEYANLAEKIVHLVEMSQKNKSIFEKINYNKANSLIQKFKKCLEEKNYKKEVCDDLIKKIDLAISNVTNSSIALKLTKEAELLKQKMSDLEIGKECYNFKLTYTFQY